MKNLKAGYINSLPLLPVLKQIWQLTATEAAADIHTVDQTHSTEALLEDKAVINKSALGQMIYCCEIDKYLENIPRSKTYRICSTAVHPWAAAKAVDNHHREGERCSSWCGDSVSCKVSLKGQTYSWNHASRNVKVQVHRKSTLHAELNANQMPSVIRMF